MLMVRWSDDIALFIIIPGHQVKKSKYSLASLKHLSVRKDNIFLMRDVISNKIYGNYLRFRFSVVYFCKLCSVNNFRTVG